MFCVSAAFGSAPFRLQRRLSSTPPTVPSPLDKLRIVSIPRLGLESIMRSGNPGGEGRTDYHGRVKFVVTPPLGVRSHLPLPRGDAMVTSRFPRRVQ